MFADPAPLVELPGALGRAWVRSLEVGTELQRRLEEARPPGVATVAAVGSLGRMELLPHSDLDLIVVLREEVAPDPGVERSAYEAVWQIAESLGYERPKPEGVFAEPTRAGVLCDVRRRGRIDEEPVIFGKRLQLLLEGRPVFGLTEYERLIREVLGWYGFGAPQPAPYHEWSYLLHDLERYRHSLAVRYQWLHRDDPATWHGLVLKGRFSRTLNLAGLLVLLGESSTRADSLEGLLPDLRRTPLERLAQISTDAATFETIRDCYERFLERMANDAFRTSLASEGCHELLATAAEFRASLAALFDRRAATWAPEFRHARWV